MSDTTAVNIFALDVDVNSFIPNADQVKLGGKNLPTTGQKKNKVANSQVVVNTGGNANQGIFRGKSIPVIGQQSKQPQYTNSIVTPVVNKGGNITKQDKLGGKNIPIIAQQSKQFTNSIVVVNKGGNQGKAGKKNIPIIGQQSKQLTNNIAVVTKGTEKKKAKGTKKKQATQQAAFEWKPIPPVGETKIETSIPKKKESRFNSYKLAMKKSNFKVVEGTPAKIQLNLDKSKKITMDKAKAGTTPQEKKDTKPEPPKTSQPSQPKSKPATTGILGRMTASAFMNIDQVAVSKPTPVTRPKPPNYMMSMSAMSLNPYSPGYPKGIPKSFLNAQHQQQIEVQNTNTPNAASSSQGPVWEALPPKPSTGPNWTNTKSRFDQLPTGQYVGQAYAPDGQGFGHDQYLAAQNTAGQPTFVQTDGSYEEPKQQYSPSDNYDMGVLEEHDEIRDCSPDSQQSGSKRLSAFQRLGPVSQPKKPKLTINLMVGKEQAVREVVDESEAIEADKYIPVCERPEIQTSLDDTVMKYITFWPWKKQQSVRRTATARDSKAAMQAELEQFEEFYDREKNFFEVLITGYPNNWTKEDVLDAILESVKGKSFIPCFIEFTNKECKFLVIRSRAALVAIHKYGFSYRKDDVVLKISIVHVNLSINQIDFIPRLILRKRLSMSMEEDTDLNLKEFTLANDVSHFLYFPLHRTTNQSELMQLQSSVPWQALTKLVLSHNKMTSLSGFDLTTHTPRLKHLDLSHNHLDKLTVLLSIRHLPLNSILLEGNPLCLDYIEHERYTKALKMMFPGLKEIDGIKLRLPGEFLPYMRNYAPPDAEEVVSKVLETLFPLLDSGPEERSLCEDLYADDAVLTITYMHKLRYSALYKDYRTLFLRARFLEEGEMDKVEGAVDIAKLINRWPKLEHDPLTFTVDVLYDTDLTTIFRVSGVMKVTTETLAEEEHLLFFSRTLVVHSIDSHEYKITNEMLYWDLPDKDLARDAFRMTTPRSKNLSLKLDAPPDLELKEKLLTIFMKITDLGRRPSERCLESNEWNLKNALEYFAKLLKQDNLSPLYDV